MLQQLTVRKHLVVGAMVVCAFSLLGGRSRADTVLRWKFKAGETTHYLLKMDMAQSMKIAGNAVDIKTNQLIDMSWKVNSVDADGSAMMSQTIDRMRMDVSSPGNDTALKYDSADKKKPEGLAAMIAPLLEGLVGKPISMKMTARGEISDIKIPQAMLDAFKKAPGMQQLGGMFTEDGFKQMTSQATLALPEEAVSEGKSWSSSSESKNPVLGTQKMTTKYTYEGTESKDGRELAKFGTQVQMKIEPAADTTIKIDIKEQDNKGAVLFDGEKGQIVRAASKGVTKMEITVMGMTFDQDVTVESLLEPVPAEKTAEK